MYPVRDNKIRIKSSAKVNICHTALIRRQEGNKKVVIIYYIYNLYVYVY